MPESKCIISRLSEITDYFAPDTFAPEVKADKAAKQAFHAMFDCSDLQFCGPMHFDGFWTSRAGVHFWSSRWFWTCYFDPVMRQEYRRYCFRVEDSWDEGQLSRSKLILEEQEIVPIEKATV